MLWWLQGFAMDHKAGFYGSWVGLCTKSFQIATGID